MPSPTPEDLADGAVYALRKHKHDLKEVAIYVGVLGGVALLGWLGVDLIHHIPIHHPGAGTCQNVAACNRAILSHPLHVKPTGPTIPAFQGP